MRIFPTRAQDRPGVDRQEPDDWGDLVVRLAAILFIGCGAASAFTAGPVHGRARVVSLGVAFASIVLGCFTLAGRWDRWDRVTRVALPIAGLALIATGNAFGSSQPYDYAVFYVIVHAWVGLALPRRASFALAPVTAVACCAPLLVVARDPATAMVSGVTTLAACVLVGEGIAWLMSRLLSTEQVTVRLASTLAAERETNAEMRRLWGLLEHSERRYRTLVNSLPVVTYVDAADDDSTPVFISPQVETLLGYAPSNWMRDPTLWAQLLHEDDRDDVIRSHLASNRTGEDFHAEYRLRARDGRVVWVRDDAYLIEEPDGERWWQGVLIDVSELKRTEQELERLAHHDPITGLANRVLFDAELDLALARARRADEVVLVCTLDLDKFKLVNDTLGHAAGDSLLRSVADRLRSAVREGDVVARIGGDEFGFILPLRASRHNASAVSLALAEVKGRVRASLAAPIVVSDTEVYASASFGAAVFPIDASDASGVLRRADSRMYRTKRDADAGDETLEVIIDRQADDELDLARRLRQSVEAGRWQLRYQTIVELALGTPIGCEALIRWDDPLFGLRSPDAFLGMVEELGLTPAMSAWMMDRLVGDVGVWSGLGLDERMAMITVNLSPRELWHPTLEARLDRLIERLPRRDLLVIEVTESAVIADPSRVASILRGIRSSGVRLALDDFGTGYSSLARLRSLPFDIVKIDRSFIQDIDRDQKARHVVRSVVRLVGSLGMIALAEGVETEQQSDIVAEEGCLLGQGFLYGPPVPAQRFAADLSRAPALLDLVSGA
jgi:diguanylate cyclase (GGDEF)-like protein/PAS domain S-box-containing protein